MLPGFDAEVALPNKLFESIAVSAMRRIDTLRRSDLASIVFLYVMAHGLLLLNKGYYWDDWTFYHIRAADAMREFVDNGNRWFGYYLDFLFTAEPFVSPKLLTFLAYLLAAVFLHRTLLTVTEMSRPSRFFVVVFFALFPVNFARVQVVPCAAYAASYCLFFLGLFLVARFEDSHKLWSRLLAHASFLASFFTNSLLVLYALVILYLVYRSQRDLARESRSRSLRSLLVKRLDFLLSPVFFWSLKRAFFMARGPFYEGHYNVISTKEVLLAPLRVLQAFLTSFIDPIDASAVTLPAALLVVLGFALYAWFGAEREADDETHSHDLALLLLGILAFALAVFPYVVVGKLPTTADWDSRHQILVPLGASLIVYYGGRLACRTLKLGKPVTRYLFSLIAVAFIARNVEVGVSYQEDWFKQMAMVENIRKQPTLRAHTTFVFEDHVEKWNALDRKYRFYEYTGLLKYALGDERHCGFPNSEAKLVKRLFPVLKKRGMLPRYNLTDYSLVAPRERVIILEGELKLDLITLSKLMVLEHLFPDDFRRVVAGLISLRLEPL